MTTPTQPADLLAQLDFEPDEQHAVADMANVGYSLMQAIARHLPGYVYNDSPAEIVGDLMGDLDDLRKKISDLTGAAHGYKQELESGRAALAAHRGEVEPVAWRYLRHLSGAAYAWTRWLGMDELHHYGPNGDLVKGPAADWKVEYAYSHPPQAQAGAGDAITDERVDRALLAFHGEGGNFHHIQWTADQRRSMRAALEAQREPE